MEKKNGGLTATSFALMVAGLLLAGSSFKIFDIILGKVLDLTPGGVLYSEWMQPSPLMTFDVYLFNWSNPQDFKDKSKKPEFTEIGPFRFHLQFQKVNVTNNEKNETISYILKRWFKFNKAESAHSLDYEVVMPNPLSAAAAYKVKDMNYLIRKSVSMSLSSFSSLYLKKTVGELLFDGFADTMLAVIRKLPIQLPDIALDKFGYFYQANGSSDGLFNIGTGHGKYKLGTLYQWNGKDSTEFYGESCRNISGASVDFYTDNMKDEKLQMLLPDLCRKITLDFIGKDTVHGIEGHRYEMDESFLDNGTKIPGNECFCAEQCIRYGAVPAAFCKGKANNYITLPHFLKADPYYADKIIGMKPNRKKHNFNVIVEPLTGVLLKMSARMQLNVFFQPIPGISMMEDAPTALFPLFWVESIVKIPEYGAFSLGILLSFRGLFTCIGVILFIIGILIYILFVFELRRERKPVKDEDRFYFSGEMSPLSEKPPRK